MKPTKEQIKKFWNYCGLGKPFGHFWYDPEGRMLSEETPGIDLNNLFKYAVPKLGVNDEVRLKWNPVRGQRIYKAEVILWESKKSGTGIEWSDKDPALALFWAIYKVVATTEEVSE